MTEVFLCLRRAGNGQQEASFRPFPALSFSEKSRDVSFLVYINSFGSGYLRQSRHGDDVAGEGDEETGAGGNGEVADGNLEMLRCA